MYKPFSQIIFYALTLLILLLKSQLITAKSFLPAGCSIKTKKPIVFTLEPLLLEVELNQQRLPAISHCYIDKLGQLWVSEADLKNWGLLLPTHTPAKYHQKSYYQLSWYPYLTYQIDRYAMKVWITAPPTCFPATVFGAQLKSNEVFRPSAPGGFLNYTATAINNANSHQNNVSALTELGVFNRWGVGTANILFYNDYQNNTQNLHAVRLDSTWILDQPEQMATWRFGDAVTGALDWSGAARFGGIQYATNFSTQPNFITFPLPAYKGEAVLPSNLNVFVNNTLRQQQTINNGPFILDNIPVVTGAGTVNIVTQDILGRRQVINLPYYTSPTLLKSDLTNFSYELGFIRDNYGIDSDSYSHFLTTGTYQRGITDKLTLGAHAELLSAQQTLGFSGNYLLNQYGIVSFALVGSHNYCGPGALASVGFNRQTPTLSYGAKATVTTTNFSEIGIQPGPAAPTITNQVFVGYDTCAYGSVGLSYTDMNNQAFFGSEATLNNQHIELMTATYSRQVYKSASLVCGGATDLCHSENGQVFISLVFGLDESRSLSAYTSYKNQNHEIQPFFQLSKNLPLGNGYGYHVLTTNNLADSLGGDISWQNDIGAYTARVYQAPNQLSYELDASGSIIHLGGDTHLARQMTNSFALVQVPGFKDVGVYYQNQLMGHTDAQGNLLIPQILAYQENKIEIDPKTLPLNTSFETTQETVLPYYHSGQVVKFNVKKIRGVNLHLVMVNGEFVPPGATVKLENDEKGIEYPVSYEGEIYLANVATDTVKGTVEWDDHVCHFTVKLPATDQAITELGNVTCY